MSRTAGIDEFVKELEDARNALEAMDGEVGEASFNPNDPASIEEAIHKMERLVDERVGSYASNPIIGPMAEAIKNQHREFILEQAAVARLATD